MQEYIAKNPRQLYWYCKTMLAQGYDYTIEHFEIKPDKVAFRLRTDLTDEEAKTVERFFNTFYR